MRRLLGAAALALLGAAAAWALTAPDPLPAAQGAAPSDAPVLSGGRAFVTAFGTFRAPNISPSPQGIGDWSDAEVMNAVMRGVGREGQHLYPALPYTSYVKAEPQDVADIVAFLRTLPPSDAANVPNDVGFPFSIRRALGAWKLLFLRDEWVLQGDLDPQVERGRYLAEAMVHCAQCHTPRNALGGLRTDAWLSGAPNPSGEGRIPGIDPGSLDWTAADIATYLATGFTPDFDVAGGTMAEVIANSTSRLPAEDRAAIAAYVKAVPAVGGG